MPLPLYQFPNTSVNPFAEPKPRQSYWQPVPKKQILGHFTHKKMEDRISQRTWYENVTYPDEVAKSLIKARNRAISSSGPKMQ